MIKILLKQLTKKTKISSILAILFMFVSGLLDTISIGLVIPLITVFIDPNVFLNNEIIKKISQVLLIDLNNLTAIKMIIYFVGVVILSSIFKLLTLKLSLVLSRKVGSEISSKVFKKIIMRPYKENLYSKSNEIISSLTQRMDSLTGLTYHFFSFISVSMTLLVMLVFALTISFKITIIVLLSIIFFYIIIATYTKKILKKKSQILYLAVNERTKVMQNALNSLREIIINFSQDKLGEIFSKYERTYRQTEAQVSFLSLFPRYVLEGFAIILLTIFALILFTLETNSSEILIILGTIVFATSKLLPLFSQCYIAWSMFYGYHKTVGDVVEMMLFEEDKRFVKNEKDIKNFPFKHSIEFKNISYKYPNSEKEIIKNLNFKINSGEKIAIIGKTGSGKSTIVSLLSGLLNDYGGEINVDGIDLKDIKFQEWISNFSHVPQEIFLSNDSIYENIKFLNKKNNNYDEEIINAANIAAVTEFSEQKENKLYYNVGDNGKNLSGGQKQRIGLARAFLQKRKILILDEATNQLDSKMEETIFKNIIDNFKDITLIVITHKKNDLDFFDKIINLDNFN
ncbi:ABC transporter ATP-binding protein [Candidatus Pelagibacter bacterium nBUS_44]|uniref:ABC transporter ATP-binding protein n=1 Tax=Candidatus Pelagibacter bacterium nBUS_44 TaxID=3374195 RepID=UPI003EBBDF53